MSQPVRLVFRDEPTPPGQPNLMVADLKTQLLVLIGKHGRADAAVLVPKEEWPDRVKVRKDEQGQWEIVVDPPPVEVDEEDEEEDEPSDEELDAADYFDEETDFTSFFNLTGDDE